MIGRSRPICDKALRKIHREVAKNLQSYVTHSKKFAHTHFYKSDCALKDACLDSKSSANYILHTKANLFSSDEKYVA